MKAVSGLMVNFFRREIPGGCLSNVQLGGLADLIGSKAGSLRTSYLSLPPFLGVAFKSFWNPVIERVGSKLALWKLNYLSLGGLITLIKLVLWNLLIYFISVFKFSLMVAKRIERLQHEFL